LQRFKVIKAVALQKQSQTSKNSKQQSLTFADHVNKQHNIFRSFIDVVKER